MANDLNVNLYDVVEEAEEYFKNIDKNLLYNKYLRIFIINYIHN